MCVCARERLGMAKKKNLEVKPLTSQEKSIQVKPSSSISPKSKNRAKIRKRILSFCKQKSEGILYRQEKASNRSLSSQKGLHHHNLHDRGHHHPLQSNHVRAQLTHLHSTKLKPKHPVKRIDTETEYKSY